MFIGDRLREIREAKKLSQGDIEKRTGLFRCYISRVERGHTIPSIGTLEKYARALEVQLYQIFYEHEEPRELPKIPKGTREEGSICGSSGKNARILGKFYRHLSRMDETDRKLLLFMAQEMARRIVKQ